MNKFMAMAIKEARKGITMRHGGPFGSIIVKDGLVVGKGHNQVLRNNDPTCHGEMMAIKSACKKLKTFDLSGCELYTTGEPCPMCLAAILWANINKVFYGATIKDNEKIGFRDDKLDKLLGGRANLPKDFLTQIDLKECLILFEEYKQKKDTIIY